MATTASNRFCSEVVAVTSIPRVEVVLGPSCGIDVLADRVRLSTALNGFVVEGEAMPAAG